MKTYTAWRQYEFSIRASSLEEAYDKLRRLKPEDAIDRESWVDDKDGEEN